MKALNKALVLAPVVLLSLTACGKLSDDKAQERMEGYSLKEVEDKYASVDIKSDVKINKRTGSFAEGGLMSSIVDLMVEGLSEDQKGAPVEEGFFTMALDVESLTGSEDVSVEYYAYKKTGLKIVSTTNINEDESGVKTTGSAKTTVYILDDGRIEKGEGSMKIDASGSAGIVSLDGTLDFSFKFTYTWNAK